MTVVDQHAFDDITHSNCERPKFAGVKTTYTLTRQVALSRLPGWGKVSAAPPFACAFFRSSKKLRYSFWSDDAGQTWTFGPRFSATANECQMAEVPGGLLQMCRSYHNKVPPHGDSRKTNASASTQIPPT